MTTLPSCVHLHLHSCYSLLTSTVRLDTLIDRARHYGMPALALTDQGNLFAAVQFYTRCLKAGIKPILGAQISVVADRFDRSNRPDRELRDQLILLCRNPTGWRNLLRIVSIGHLEGSHDQPRVDPETLRRHREGLIALSAGSRGAVGRLLAEGRHSEAKTQALWLRDLYQDPTDLTGSTPQTPNFYLELQRHGHPDEESLYRATVELAYELNLPLVATNNVHFLDRSDHKAHDVLSCIGSGHTLHQQNRPRLNDSYYFLSPAEMQAHFADVPEALTNTLLIAQRCNVRLQLGRPMLPDFAIPEPYDLTSWLHHEAETGLERRLQPMLSSIPDHERKALRQNYRDRLTTELEIIIQMGFPGYFLIVSDFIRWAKQHQIPVGPGRGSGAGSLVAWSLEITDLDPIRYQLLFERFLNPERVSMPDFDIDFCVDRREEVIRYVQEKYGADRVAQIITFGTLQARAAIRDVGRVMELPLGQVDSLAKMVPNILGITLTEAVAQEERLATLMAEDPEVHECLTLAQALEGLPRSASTHAAGVVISNGALTDTVPLYRDPRSEMPVTQFNMSDAEKAGLVKFDFLGLRTLTVIDQAIKSITAETILIDSIPLDDQATFAFLREGYTRGIFQLESSGIREVLRKLAPDTLEDIIALVALYRPGPLGSGMVDDFINRKHGRTKVTYPLPQLEPILRETYGVILYQEQVMKIAQVLAGYSLGGADLLRRAMGKKKPQEMAAQRQIFLTGTQQRQIATDKATAIFDLMEKFADYGFNKSHSAAYGLISYQTAWLKAHHRLAFMAATLTCEMAMTDKLVPFIRECRDMGIAIAPPDINRSGSAFLVEGATIRYALSAIKNVGGGAVQAILLARQQGGDFQTLPELCRRVTTTSINRRVLESLIKSGACDSFGDTRPSLLQQIPTAMAYGSRYQEEKSAGFRSLFDDGNDDDAAPEPSPASTSPLSIDPTLYLEMEKEVLGFFLTSHPLHQYEQELASYGVTTTLVLRDGHDSSSGDISVTLAGLIVDHKFYRTKRGERMAFLTLEDVGGQIELVLFPEALREALPFIDGKQPVVVTGLLGQDEDETLKINVEKTANLQTFRDQHCRWLTITATAALLTEERLQQLNKLLRQHSGTCRVALTIDLPDATLFTQLGESHCIHANDSLLESLRNLFGNDAITYSRLSPWQQG
ncbi:MAG: DNA polymerase III subunit alpha [Magnetococcales bacterium]|nr:DNA polymerase III subunit alpha [Magnetococcales bacterium]